jgi:hypothetical protein
VSRDDDPGVATGVDTAGARFDAAAAWCSAAAAAAFGAVPVMWMLAPGFTPARPWLFCLGAAAFASNVIREMHPGVRAAAALLQAVCVFEVLGFSMGLTITIHAGAVRWQVPDWRVWLLAWGLMIAGGCAMTLSALALRKGEGVVAPSLFEELARRPIDVEHAGREAEEEEQEEHPRASAERLVKPPAERRS